MNRFVEVTRWQRQAIVLLGILTCVFWILSMVYDANFFFVAVGTSLLLVCLMPVLALRQYDWFCPWSAVIFAVIYGGTFPSVCMSFGLPSQDFLHDEIFLGQPPSFFVWPSLLLIASFAFLAIGYFSSPQRQQTSHLQIARVSDPSRLFWVCLACTVVSALAFAVYFSFNGGISGGLSTKRGSVQTLDIGADKSYNNHGYLRQLGKLGNIALLLLAAHWCRYKPDPRSIRAYIQTLLLGSLLLVSILFPFYASSRAGMLWVVMGLAATLYYMRSKIVSTKAVGLIGLLVAVTIFVTAVRNGGSENKEKMVSRISHLFLNRHGPDVAVTAHIIDGIPDTLDYRYGETIYAWLLAPVPRELMPNKPMVHTGPIIGQSIYNKGLTGIPTGLTAELYWNFHIVGVIFGSLILGAYLKWVYMAVMRIQIDPVLLAPLYAFVVFPIGFKMTSVAVGPGLIMPLVDLVMVGFIVWLSSVPSAGWEWNTESLDRLSPSHRRLPT